MRNPCYRTKYRQPRHGSVYVAVLGVALIVGVIGLASMQVSRVETRAAVTANEMAHAQMMAQSGVAYALAQIELAGSAWRSSFVHGEESPSGEAWFEVGGGKIKFILWDDDGDLADDDSDLVTIRAIGRVGSATSVATAKLAPTGGGLSCLEAALHSDDALSIDGATVDDNGTGMLSSNSDVLASGAATIRADVESAGQVQGGVFHGESSSGVPVRELPEPETVLETYQELGTPIVYGNIPGGVIDHAVVSRGYNPYGAENSRGIYYIDCDGNDIVIQNSRIEATLLLINTGANSEISGRIHWTPAVANYPALLVQGSIQFNADLSQPLDEGIFSTSFNPEGAPYPDEDDWDSDHLDSYEGIIQGLVYVSGNLTIANNCNIEGVIVVGGECHASDDLTLSYRDLYLSNPPPGFADGTQMQVVPSSWKRAERID